MVQADHTGQPLFFHRNLDKWATGIKPERTLREKDRTWTQIKRCETVLRSQHCDRLLFYRLGLLRWRDRSGVLETQTTDLAEASGDLWELESLATRLFHEMWWSPAYSEYARELVGIGPPGTYKQTCRDCRMYTPEHPFKVKRHPSMRVGFGCSCQGRGRRWRRSVILHPDMCNLADNVNGVLRCLKRSGEYVPAWGEDDDEGNDEGGRLMGGSWYIGHVVMSPWRTAKLIFVWLCIATVVCAFLVAVRWTCSLFFLGGGKGSRDD